MFKKSIFLDIGLFRSGLFRQYFYGVIASLTYVFASSCHVWTNPVQKVLVSADSPVLMTSLESTWIAFLPQVGSVVSSIIVGRLTDMFGRKWILMVSALLQAASWIATYFIHTFYILCIMRTLQGCILGAVFTVTPMYLSEIASRRSRGRIGTLYSTGWNFGVFSEYLVGKFVDYNGLLVFNAVVPLLFMMIFYFAHESPYYLIMKGRRDEAAVALASFRHADSSLKEELDQMEESVEAQRKTKADWGDLIKDRRGRRGLLITSILSFVSFAGGTVSVLIYANKAFRRMGMGDASGWFTLGMGGAMVVVSLATMFTVDKWGRRQVLITSLGGAVVTVIPVLVYNVLRQAYNMENEVLRNIAVVCCVLFPPFISYGVTCISYIYRGELFSSSTRSLASGIATIIVGVASTLSIGIFLPLDESNLTYVNYIIYFIICLGGLLFCMFCIPETKGKTFDEVQEVL